MMSSFAGSDSTASTMQSFSWHVLRDAAIYAKLRRELDEATAAGKLSEMPQWNEVQALPYFQACLKEAMRIRPAVGLNITRLVPPEGAEVEDQFLPSGTRIALNGWVLHRNKEIFGNDPEIFRPERWLEGDAKTMEKFMFQVRHIVRSNPDNAPLTQSQVWRRRSSLYRQESGAPRNEQDSAALVPRLRVRAAASRRGAEIPHDLLRRAVRLGSANIEALGAVEKLKWAPREMLVQVRRNTSREPSRDPDSDPAALPLSFIISRGTA